MYKKRILKNTNIAFKMTSLHSQPRLQFIFSALCVSQSYFLLHSSW